MKFHRLLGAAAAVFSLRAFGALVQFFFQILVARQWGVENFGLFSTALTLTVVSSMIARWGVDQWVLRELPATMVMERTRGFVPVLINGFVFVLSVSLLVTLGLFAASGNVASLFMGGEQEIAERLLQIMALSIVPFAALNFIAESFRAINRHLLATLLQTVLVPLLSVFLLVGFSLVNENSLTQVAVAYALACFMTFIAGALLLRRACRLHAGGERFVWLLKKMVGETTSIAIVVLLSTWLAYAYILVLGYFYGPSEVGLYSAAQRIVLIPSFMLISLNGLLWPRFALLVKQKEHTELYSLYRKSLQWMAMIGLPIVLLLAVFSSWFLSWFGPNFIAAQHALLFLLLGQFFIVLAGPIGILMMMGQHVATMRTYTLITVLIHFPLTMALTRLYGATGAAIATCMSAIMLNALCWRFIENQRRATCEPDGR